MLSDFELGIVGGVLELSNCQIDRRHLLFPESPSHRTSFWQAALTVLRTPPKRVLRYTLQNRPSMRQLTFLFQDT